METSRILIIDDDSGMLKALPEMLRDQVQNLTVDTTASAPQALQKVAEIDYDAIISDIKMPGMDGLTLLSQIKALRPETPILLMTAHTDRDVVVSALRGGAYDFIQKPIDEDYFVASLQRAIQVTKLSRQVAAQKLSLERHAKELEVAVKNAVADAQVAQRRLAFLASASTLLSSSLDYKATLDRVARLGVLYLADYCVVDIMDEDGRLQCAAVAHADRSREDLLRQMRQYYADYPDKRYVPQEIAASNRSLLRPAVTDVLLQEVAVAPEQLEIMRKLSPKSTIIVPLVSPERLLGVISFCSTRTERRYGPEDLSLAEELTRRAALAVDNARLYNEAQVALKVRDQFLSIASHELKTPMTSILASTQLLLRRAAKYENTDQNQNRTLNLLLTQTLRMNRLVDTMLDLSRLETGQFTIEQEPLDISELVKKIAGEMAHISDSHVIECQAGENPIVVSADELRLEQVLQNLVYNAIKYSPDGGKVTVALELKDHSACLKVSDEGIGIPQEALPKLFERFYRAENLEGRQISGMGLGLFVVKEIITLHGGTIGVTSEQGKGSTFTIQLPLLTADQSVFSNASASDYY
ncbi:MAG TPA: ATP-binding protein [Chloroflexia bacterium]|nr:ATP-binding protein [Chloroflexia bacterium]